MRKNRYPWRAWRALTLWGVMLVATLEASDPADCLGPSALAASADGKAIYVALADAKKVAVFDLQEQRVTGSIRMPAEPTGLAVSPDGTKLYVTCAAAQSSVVVIDVASGEQLTAIPVGHTAMGPAVSPDGRRLYVCNRFDHNVSVIELQAGREVARVPVVREPVASAVTPDGKSLLVVNHLPAGPSNSFYVSPVVTFVDTQTRQTTSVQLPNGSTGLRDVGVGPDGRYAYVTHILGNYELVPAQVVGGWTNTNVLSVIDTSTRELVNTVQLDDFHSGAANPWGVASTADGKWICVAHAGTDELSVIDARGMLEKLRGGTYSSAVTGGIPNSPSILTGLRRRIRLRGKGPRQLAVVGSTAYVAGYFSDSLDVVPLEGGARSGPATIALGPRPRPTVQRRGQMRFNDATICYQEWQSCASCHPDGRADGLNWDLVNDGVGNPKNTKSMLLAHQTPPSMSGGVRPSAEAAVRSGLAHILFADQPEEVPAAIDAYLRSLKPVPSPYLADGRLSASARRGKKLFESDRIGCSKCHPAPLYTDRLPHDVRTRGPYDQRAKFDTPTLIEVWRTAPYLHDGRYNTIRQLIAEGKHGSTHGDLDQLDEGEVAELVEFVRSL